MGKRHLVRKEEIPLGVRLGLNVRSLRQRLGITQEELAWRADMHRTYIADIERGGRNLTLQSIGNLARALEIPIEGLIAQRDYVSGAAGSSGPPGEVLLVEDNESDADLTLRAFRRAKLGNPVRVVRDGEEALEYLLPSKVTEKKADRVVPQLILLDLNLPKNSGIEVLKRIRTDSLTREIPVVVLTGSRHDQDIIACAKLGVENYIIKPVSFEGLCRVVPKLSLSLTLVTTTSLPAAPVTRVRDAKRNGKSRYSAVRIS